MSQGISLKEDIWKQIMNNDTSSYCDFSFVLIDNVCQANIFIVIRALIQVI